MHTVAILVLAVASIPLFIVDIREHRLPNEWTGALAAAGLLINAAKAIFSGSPRPIAASLIAGGRGLAAMWLLHLVTRAGIGFGDVKLVAALGLLLADRTTLLFVVCIAFMAAALWLLPQFAVGRYRRDSRLAFGPFILIGAWSAIALT